MVKKNPYDMLYQQIDFVKAPFGYSKDYVLWRASKLKREFAKYITKDGKILDVGGGYGILAEFLPDFVDRKNYYNLDVSEEMLKYSPYNNILASAEKIPCSNAFFDYVISSEVLEHVNSKVEALKECYRVLKPGGLFMLSTPRVGWMEDFKRSPFLPFITIDPITTTVLTMLHPRRVKLSVPEGVKDEPSDESWLKGKLEETGFVVINQHRADNHLPWARNGEGKFWRWFADRFVDPQKYGHCTIVICSKPKVG